MLEPPKYKSPSTHLFAQWSDGVDSLLDLCSVKGMQVKIVNWDIKQPHKQTKQLYSKTCLKGPLKNRQNKDFNDKWKRNEGRKYYPLGVFCNTFDLH